MGRIKYQEAIGIEVRRGHPPAGPMPAKADLNRRYVKEGRSIRDVAALLGCSKDAIQRALRKYGIEARPNAARSKLRTIPLRNLKAGIKARGTRGLARDLGVDPSTLRHHLKVREGR